MDSSHDVLAVTGIHAQLDLPDVASFPALKVHKREKFFVSDFEFFTIL